MTISTVATSEPERWQIGDLHISHGWHSRAATPSAGVAVMIPTGVQPLLVSLGTVEPILRPPFDLLYLPAGGEPLVRTSGFSGWRVHLDGDRLCQLALELAQHRVPPAKMRRRLQQMTLLQPRFSPERELVLSMVQMLGLGHQPPLAPQLLAQLGTDRIIQRLLAMVLCRDLIEPGRTTTTAPALGRAAIVDDLLAWIDERLDQPLQLADLAARSGYSHRSLRNIFHERYGCSPMQWIRQRRLSKARMRLLDPRPGDTVAGVAVAMGYRHTSQFSRDFHALHGVRPSELLREGLRLLASTQRSVRTQP